MLERMVDAAKDFGATAELELPSMNTSAIGEVFSSVASSITTTQSEMTDVGNQKQRKVRQVLRESRREAAKNFSKVSSDDFFIYPSSMVKRLAYDEWFEGRRLVTTLQAANLQHPDACFVALAKGAFGEGAERLAYRFFEVGSDGCTIVGKPLVAKENRIVVETEGKSNKAAEEERSQFAKCFCKTQQLACRLASEFREKMIKTPRIHHHTPKLSFLDCSIYVLSDTDFGEASVLVEEKLDDQLWYKWNSNNGFVNNDKRNREPRPRLLLERKMVCGFIEDKKNVTSPIEQHRFGGLGLSGLEMLDVIGEEDEDHESSGSTVEDTQPQAPIEFTAFDVAQAFSHFTYHASGRKRLVCDLQGVHDKERNELILSDPVIHYYNVKDDNRRYVHGRTDRGKKGFDDFFSSHHEFCGSLCKLMNRGLQSVPRKQKASDKKG